MRSMTGKILMVPVLLIMVLFYSVAAYASPAAPAVQTGWTRSVPQDYFAPASVQGRVERITYRSKDYAGDDKEVKKIANVYLPAGYDENDSSRKYDVFYIMHGLSGNADEFFGYGGGMAKNMIDNMIEKKDINPMIIVAPTFDIENKPQEFDRAVSEVRQFHKDFLNDLMPAVEGKYHTYAAGTSAKELEASRNHRAFGGFSLGSVTTWMQFCYNYDYIRYYLPMSSACWYCGGYGNSNPRETCDYFQKIITENNLNKRGYFIYACTGTNDTLRGEVDRQMEEIFLRSCFFTPEHVVYYKKNNGLHDYNAEFEYIYNALPAFFKGAGVPNTRVIWR